MRDKLKMVFKTMYDPVTDTIYAKEGTLLYFHEEGHREWFKNGTEQALQMWEYYFLLFAVCALAMENYLFAKLWMIGICFLMFASEIHAWIYAFRKYYSQRKQTESQNRGLI